jgi:hypothetical protein
MSEKFELIGDERDISGHLRLAYGSGPDDTTVPVRPWSRSPGQGNPEIAPAKSEPPTGATQNRENNGGSTPGRPARDGTISTTPRVAHSVTPSTLLSGYARAVGLSSSPPPLLRSCFNRAIAIVMASAS